MISNRKAVDCALTAAPLTISMAITRTSAEILWHINDRCIEPPSGLRR
jgi:hypothetical protein